MILLPYEIETLTEHKPWANRLIIATCVLTTLWLFIGEHDPYVLDALVLDGWRLPGLFTHLFLHAGLMHLIGNMVFLWVFGNAINSNTDNFVYPLLFIGLGLISATVHNLFDGSTAVGASGAINGIVGIALAMYPRNKVGMFWLFFFKPITFQCRLWLVVVFWLAFDIWGAVSGGGDVAYFAHLGGLFGGLIVGTLGLRFGWLQLTEWDNRSLLEIILNERPTGRTWD